MGTDNNSKQLENYDESGFLFAKEMLSDDTTSAINFDRIQKHPQKGYIIFEYLLCEETQHVNPYTSHPNYYFDKNPMKFLSLWRLTLDFHATLYLVNYAKSGTKHEDKIKVIEVTHVTNHKVIGNETKYTRKEFQAWFRTLNRECASTKEETLSDIYRKSTLENLESTAITLKKHKGKTIKEVFDNDEQYLRWMIRDQVNCAELPAVEEYIKRKDASQIV